MDSITPTEATRLLCSDRQEDPNSPVAVLTLGVQAKKSVTSVFAVILLTIFARSIASTSRISLTRSLACAEYYDLHPLSLPTFALDCRREEVDDRFSSVNAYMSSASSLASCIFALVLSPYLIRKLGYRGCLALGAVHVTLHMCFSVWIAAHAQNGTNQLVSPTLALNVMVAECAVSGLLGCPEVMLELVSRSVVIDSVPPGLRSTWLARLKSCTLLGALAASAVLQPLRLDTSSDLVVDPLPIRLGAIISLLAIPATFITPSSTSTPPPQAARDITQAEPNRSRNRMDKLKHNLACVLLPLRLIWQPALNEATGAQDWSLSRVIGAYMLTNEIGVSTETFLIYCTSRFGLHAQDLSLVLSWLSICAWVSLVIAFPILARWIRERFLKRDHPAQGAAARVEWLLSLALLMLDAAGWLIIALAGRTENFPLVAVGLAFYGLSCPMEATLASLASMLLPDGATTEELSAALSFLNSFMCTACPLLTSNIYRVGLHAHLPEMVFVFTALISSGASLLIATTRLSGPQVGQAN